jgi:peptidyl-prolyl isomerase D
MEATQLVPDDQVIAAELAKVQQRKKALREKQKQAFKKMFG